MRPSRHIIASVAISGGLWFFTKSIYAASLCLLSGIFVDFDHFVEYVIHHGRRGLTYENVYEASVQTGERTGDKRFKKVYLVFHIGEIAVLLWIATIFTKNIYILAIALGFTLHLVLDSVGNPLCPLAHFFIWRAINGFDVDKCSKKELKSLDGRG